MCSSDLWPVSIPARGIVSTTKASRLFAQGCRAVLDDEFLTFYDTSSRPKPLRWRLPLIRVRDVVERRNYLLIRMRKLDFVAIPKNAFETDDDRAVFERMIGQAIERRYAEF